MEGDENSTKRRKLGHDASPADLVTGESAEVEFIVDPPNQSTFTANNALPNPGTADSTAAPTSISELGPKASPDAAQGSKKPMGNSLSKNQLKKLRKKAEWEAGREDRKAKRKEKNMERKHRKKEEKQAQQAAGTFQPPPRTQHTLLPITFIIDCQFDDLMTDVERISLGSQITRCYSDNSKARYQGHLVMSGWGGQLKERFDTILNKHHENWKGVSFTQTNFIDAANAATIKMSAEGGKFEGAFAKYKIARNVDSAEGVAKTEATNENHDTQTSKLPEDEGPDSRPTTPPSSSTPPIPLPEIIYLTSDSPHTLASLSPYSTYIIGGLVDKNRHKRICYKKACEADVKTAKLPIGDLMEMSSRFVLTTNHVCEIMVRWLECGDWGEAFTRVIPKRKGGVLKSERNIQDGAVDGVDAPENGAGENGEEDDEEELKDDNGGAVDISDVEDDGETAEALGNGDGDVIGMPESSTDLAP